MPRSPLARRRGSFLGVYVSAVVSGPTRLGGPSSTEGAGGVSPTGWDGMDIEEYSRKYARALRHQRSGQRLSRSRGGIGATGATVTTGILTAVFAIPGGVAVADVAEDGDGKVAGRFGAEDSWAEFEANEVDPSEDLDKEPAAASRAKFRVPIEVSRCVPVDAADGARQMVQQAAVYMPLQEGTFAYSSPFGYRVHPTLGAVILHEGVDMSAPLGTPIYAVADGVVASISSSAGQGDFVVLEHTGLDGAVYRSFYLHQYMSQITVHEGQQVSAGDQIGHVGNSGRSTGPHLHFEVRDASDTAIDPLGWLESQGAVYLGEGC